LDDSSLADKLVNHRHAASSLRLWGIGSQHMIAHRTGRRVVEPLDVNKLAP